MKTQQKWAEQRAAKNLTRIVREDADVEKTAEGLFKGAYLRLHPGVVFKCWMIIESGILKALHLKRVGYQLEDVYQIFTYRKWVEITILFHLNLLCFGVPG